MAKIKGIKNEKEYDASLVIGLDINQESEIKLTSDVRQTGFAVIGTKNSRKSSYLLPTFAKQDIILGDKIGSTFITNGIDDSYTICAVARHMKRKTQLTIIKPSYDARVYEEIINDKPYDFDRINSFFDYATLVREKNIIVIDSEEYKYGKLAENFIRKILLHIFISIQNRKITLNREHYLYIDTADKYIKDIERILLYGSTFNLNTTIFLESRDRLDDEAKNIIDINIKNVMLLSNLVSEDATYFNDIIMDKNNLGNPDVFFYKILNNNKKIEKGYGNLASTIDDKEFKSLDSVNKTMKKEEKISDNNIPLQILTNEFNKKYYFENKIAANNIPAIEFNENDTYTDNVQDNLPNKIDIKDTIIKNILQAKEPYNDKKYEYHPTPAQLKYINTIVNIEESKKRKEIEEKKSITDEKTISQSSEDIKNNVKEDILIEDTINNETPLKMAKNDEIEGIIEDNNTKNVATEELVNNKNKESVIEPKEEDSEDIIVTIDSSEEEDVNSFEEALNDTYEKIIDEGLENNFDMPNEDEFIDDEEFYIQEPLVKVTEDVSLGDNVEEDKNFLDLDSLLEDE